jgi:hypothetical protein
MAADAFYNGGRILCLGQARVGKSVRLVPRRALMVRSQPRLDEGKTVAMRS